MADETQTAEAGAEMATSCVDSHGGALGMPQLCGDWFGNQIFWLVVALVAIYLILSRIALPRIASVLAERSGTITNDVAAAEELKLKAQEAEESYNKALADARTEASRIVAEAKADIQKELDVELAKADEEISAKTAESEAAIAAIHASAADSVQDVAKETAEALVAALGGQSDASAIAAAVSDQVKG